MEGEELNHLKSDPESIAAHLRFAAEILIAATIIVCSQYQKDCSSDIRRVSKITASDLHRHKLLNILLPL
jgi:hypothetical protein